MKFSSSLALPGMLVVLATAACAQDLDLGSTLDEVNDGGDAGITPPLTDSSSSDIGNDQGPTLTVDPLNLVSDVDIGQGHACALSLGELYCWGSNEYGQLGIGDGANRRAATRVGQESDWADVELSARSSCAVKTDGRLYCWGRNHLGQVGDGTKSNRTIPTEISFPGTPVQLNATQNHFCAVNDSNELWCWGENSESNIGQGENEFSGMRDFEQPTQVTADAGVGWIGVGAGGGHTCGLRADNVVMCWGRNTQGMAGGASDVMQVLDPSVIADPPPRGNNSWTEVQTGSFNTCLRGTDDEWFCLGNAGGERLPGVYSDAFEPTPIDRPPGGQLAMGTFHSCQLNDVGELFCWGVNLDGLIVKTEIGESLAAQQVGQELGPIELVGVGRFNTCVIVSGGSLFCRGENGDGTVGANAPNGDITDWRQVGQLR